MLAPHPHRAARLRFLEQALNHQASSGMEALENGLPIPSSMALMVITTGKNGSQCS
jgi:hypothetical protein